MSDTDTKRSASQASKALRIYFRQLDEIPIVSAEEERALAIAYRNGDVEAGKKLVTGHLRFAVNMASRFSRQRLQLEDLIQAANIGLIRALKRFDPDRGVKFISYAAWWIRAEISILLKKTGRMIQVPTRMLRRYKNIETFIAKKLLQDGEPPSEEVIAKKFRLTPKRAEDFRTAMSHLEEAEHWISLDAHITAGKKSGQREKFSDRIPDHRPLPDEDVSGDERRAMLTEEVSRALLRLDARERHIIQKRFLDDEPETLDAIGRDFGISRERVRQLESRALKRLRENLREFAPPATA